MDPFLDPLLIINRSMRFEQDPGDVAEARQFIGHPERDDSGAAEEIVRLVHSRMRTLPTAFGAGMPKTLREIVRRRGGNCVSHSVAAVALLRDSGFAARLISENAYTRFSLLRSWAALTSTPIGPTLNGHVWVEVMVDGAWCPADAQLGIYGRREWVDRRLVREINVAAYGMGIREHWRFPLRIRRLGLDGQPDEDATCDYLLDALEELARQPVPPSWSKGVRFFGSQFNWEGHAGFRILLEAKRLRRMARAKDKIDTALLSAKSVSTTGV